MPGLVGKKVGMTTIFDEQGRNIPCTVIEVGPNVVTQIKTVDKDGYNAVQLAYDEKKEKHSNKAMIGHFQKAKTTPKKKVIELCRTVSERTSRNWEFRSVDGLVAELNRLVVGWANYFCLGPVSKAYVAVDRHVSRRLRRWLCGKHKVQGQGTSRFPNEYLYQKLGLVQLKGRTHNFPWANA